MCGNFAFVGTSKGRLLKYNLQSGSFRGEYLSESNHSDDFVVGIATDAFNKIIVAVLSKGRILCWDLNTLKFKEETSIGTRISQVEVHRDSGLFAIVCEDFSVRVFDISNLRCIRTLRGNKFRITDISFSSDAHWIASAAVDGSVRVYDLASSTLIDCFRFSSPVTTLALSPSGEFLATAHADNVGIFLWVNKSYFSNLYLRSVDNFPKYMDFPEEEIKLDADFLERLQNDNSADEEMADDIKATSEKFGRVGFVPIESNMIIRSGLPNSKWETLDKLELIKERNKPKLPIKKNTEVPFFLEQAFEAVDEKESEEKEVSEISHAESDSVLSLLLSKCSRDGSYSDITAYLMSLMPAALETEFRVLSFDVDEMEQDEKAIIEERLEQMLQYFKHELISRKNYELIQAYLNLFLQIHREELVSSKSLLDQLSEISALQSDEWQRLESLFHSNSCLLNFCSNIQF